MAYGSVDMQKKKWVKPELKHMRAGSAETSPPGVNDDSPSQKS